MLPAPVTFLFAFERVEEKMRPFVMHEFAANGAKHLVLNPGFLRMMMSNKSMIRQIPQELAAEGLSFLDAHAIFDFMDLNCPTPAIRPIMMTRNKLQMQLTALMGVKTLTFHTANHEGGYPEYPLETQFDFIRRSLDEMLPLAEELGITICIENIWFRLTTAKRLLALKKEFPTDALGLCYDSGHANIMDQGRNDPESTACGYWGNDASEFEDHVQILEKMLPNVVNCHLHDNNGIHDQHLNIGLGNIDWKRVVGLLKKAPRLQVVQSEVGLEQTRQSIHDVCEKFRWLNEL